MKVALTLATALLAIESAIGTTTKYKYTEKSTGVSFFGFSPYNGCEYYDLRVSAYNQVDEDNGQKDPRNLAYVQTYGSNDCNGYDQYVSYYFELSCDIGDGLTANPNNGAVLDFKDQCSGWGYVFDSSGYQDFTDGIPISLHATLTPTEPPYKYKERDYTIQAGGLVIQSKSRGTESPAEGDFTGSIGGVSIPDFDDSYSWIYKYDYGYFMINK